MDKLISRKFILSMVVVISINLLCWYGRIDAGVYATIMVATVGAYITGNVTQKNITK